jgi:hypothetical protein
MDCNDCKHLNITESEQHKRGCHIPHICTLYNTQVYHYSSKFNTYYYDPRLFPCDECKKHIEDVLENISRITDAPYKDVEYRFNKLWEKLNNGQR